MDVASTTEIGFVSGRHQLASVSCVAPSLESTADGIRTDMCVTANQSRGKPQRNCDSLGILQEVCLRNNNEETNCFRSYFASTLSRFPNKPRMLDATSRRVHILGKVNGVPVSGLTIDTAADIPCISQTFISKSPSPKSATVHPIPPNLINLRLHSIQSHLGRY